MSDTGMNIQFDMPKNRSNVIKVIGVGGGGSNAINHMFQQGINGVDFVICNTDAQALENSPVPTKVQLGVNLTEGLGAGANPDIGEDAALESYEDLKTLLDTNTKMVFITAGMGGGTGTGAAPIIAKQARDMDILTVGIVTIPFKFEGKMRNEQARKGLEKLRKNVDSLIVIDNNKLREVYGNLGFRSGFSKADEVLATASKGIAEVITHHYMQNIDLRDAKTVLSDSGTAIMGSAKASGGNRAQEAIVKALDSPLLNDNEIVGAKNVLLLIVSGSDEITIDEIGEINDHIQAKAGHGANIIMGVGEDQDLGDGISVTIIATGFDQDQQHEIINTEGKKVIHILEDEQKAVQDLSPDSSAVSEKSMDKGFEKPAENKVEKKIVHTLDDEIEDEEEEEEEPAEQEMPLIPTSELIRNLEVDYQSVVYDENEFVFIDHSETAEDVPEIEPENPITQNEPTEQPLFKFDFPLPEEDTPEKEDEEPAKPENKGNVSKDDSVSLFPGESKDDVVRYSLEDYLEKEKELTEAKPEPEEEKDELRPQLVKRRGEREVRREVRRERTEEQTEKPVEKKEIDPLNSPISDQITSRAAERRERMKRFNYKFRKSSNIDEFESQPAYKRAGLDLNEGNPKNTENKMSRSSISEEDGEIQIRSNNSFLHDNVD